MAVKLKKYNIDGLPGVTLQGIKGGTGERGCRVYTNYDSSLSVYGTYDIWMSEITTLTEPYKKGIRNCNVSEQPIKNDYILYSQSGTITLYGIIAYVTNKSIDTFESEDIDPVLMKSIKEYYSTEDPSTGKLPENDLCVTTTIDTWKSNENSVSVVTSTDNISFSAWNGDIIKNTTDKKEYASKINVTNEILRFDVLSVTGKNLGKIKVTAEFHVDMDNKAEMYSELQNMWKNKPDEYKPLDYPSGYPVNYNYTLNYDNEHMDDFEIVIKDWSESSDRTFHTSKSRIKKNAIVDYTISLYVYSYKNSFITKSYIGELSLAD